MSLGKPVELMRPSALAVVDGRYGVARMSKTGRYETDRSSVSVRPTPVGRESRQLFRKAVNSAPALLHDRRGLCGNLLKPEPLARDINSVEVILVDAFSCHDQ